MAKDYLQPHKPPVYQARQPVKTITRKRLYSFVDSAFAAYGLFLTFWFVLLLFLSGLTFSWQAVVSLIVFWLLLTYFALPRLHQMFTTWYLPDYFMARTKTADGLLGDPVNLAVNGSADDIHAAMRRAGWIQADEITLRSSLGIVRSSITRKSYPAAPVSDLFLFGNRHDFAYQQEVDGNAAQRHHIRFWKVPDGWKLPGGRSVDWLAAGTYDRAVGLSTMTLQITHKIDADVDAERDYVIDTVRYHDKDAGVSVIENFSTPFHDQNGGGDSVMTDGDMPVLDVSGAHSRAVAAGIDLDQADYLDLDTSNEFLNEKLPPKSLMFVGLLLVLQLCVSLLALFAVETWSLPQGGLSEGAVLAISAIIVVVMCFVLLVLTIRQYRWPRLVFLIIASLAATGEMILLWGNQTTNYPLYIEAGMSVLLVLVFSAPSVREWVYSIRRRGDVTRGK
ncbi:LssY C-terminal domain-containing protein [Arcanobacterium pinnipediorum]|uniref:LssY C-terminal domain-containing protein n=1 Tax=Arcanobacterium pinnipediorum TaxID=1503041 RepID=A0ABY5AFN6_9ACTO|nr:LssY C-terminal domain-containing protein [Arcanobacterium pinnipediorum]USR78820.1 LssY C-terminal domain-containing protein [Arcanobacterium pinnipediorum]